MLSKLVRIGRDAELRYTASGKAVIGLACVYDIGYGEKKKGQWIEAAIWGKQAEALAPFLLKGVQIVIYADDVELEVFTKGDGTQGSKLKCRVVNVDLTDKKSAGTSQQSQPQRQQQSQQRAPQQQPSTQQQGGFDNSFDSDIPF